MDLGLQGKIILITAGGTGIGAAISHACAAEGAVPVIVSNDRPDMQRVCRIVTRDVVSFSNEMVWQ